MGIGAVGDDGIAERHHLLRYIGVQIESYNDGHQGTDAGAEAAEDLAIGVGKGLTDGSAVEGDEQGVNRFHGADGAN